MKRFLILFLTFVIAAVNSPLAIAEEFEPFAGINNVTVAAIGGSLTAGDGSDYVNDWARSLVNKYLPEKYPNSSFTLKNAGVGGTSSEFGMYRFEKDVAIHDPDLVIIEYAVNDRDMIVNMSNGQYLPENTKRNVESMIRQCLAMEKVPYVITLCLSGARNTNASTTAITEISEYYGVPVIDVNDHLHNTMMADGGELDYCDLCRDKSASERINCPAHKYHSILNCASCLNIINAAVRECTNDSEAVWETHFANGACAACDQQLAERLKNCSENKHSLFYNVSSDGVHPRTAGYQMFYRYIKECIDENPQGFFKKPQNKARIYTHDTDPSGFMYPKTLAIEDVIGSNSSWKVGKQTYVGPTGTAVNTYESKNVGDLIEFKFYGPTLSFFSYRGADLGAFRVTVDKGEADEFSKTFVQYYVRSLGYGDKTQYTVSMGGLKDTWHTAVIENIGYQNGSQTVTNSVMAYYICDTNITSPFVCNASTDMGDVVLNENKGTVKEGTKVITLNISGEFDDLSNNIELYRNGTKDTYTGELSGDNYVFNLNSPVRQGDTIEVVIDKNAGFNGKALNDDLTYRLFTNNAVIFSDLTFTDADGNALNKSVINGIQFKVTADNKTAGTSDILAIIAVKSKDSTLKMLALDSGMLEPGAKDTYTCTLDYEEIAPGDFLEIYLWENGRIVPYTDKILYSLSDLKITSVGKDVLTFFPYPIAKTQTVSDLSADRSGDIVTVSGKTTGNIVSIKALDADGNVVYIDTVIADGNSFEVSCNFKELKEEAHMICVASN